MERGGYVYILANKGNTVLYVGVTSDLSLRIWQHKTSYYPNSFTSKYRVKKLVYYKGFESIKEAISFEKKLKGSSRLRKNKLIINKNPSYKDLSDDIQDL